MKKYNYDLTFANMVEEIFKTYGCYQGEEFNDGVYIQVLYNGIRVQVFSNNWYGAKDIGNFILTRGAVEMKYRRVYTQSDAMRKV